MLMFMVLIERCSILMLLNKIELCTVLINFGIDFVINMVTELSTILINLMLYTVLINLSLHLKLVLGLESTIYILQHYHLYIK